MDLPVTQLSQPPNESRLLRQADSTFISKLKDKMVQDPSGPGAAPIAVLCKTDDFNIKFKDVYKYEVLGGLHTMIAKSQLIQEYPENRFFGSVTAEVYVGLSDEECLRLAQRHNTNSHFTHKLTHRDMVGYGIVSTYLIHAGFNFIRFRHAEQGSIECLVKLLMKKHQQQQRPGESLAKQQ